MPWSAIKKFEEEFQFNSLFLLTRDGEYYRNLLNPEVAIETRCKEINKLSEKQTALTSEKEMIETQIALLSAHIYKYPLQTVEKYLESVRGILCNILVCLAVWCFFKLKSESGKLIMIFWCLFAFITTGYEHSVANMTLLSAALLIPHPMQISMAGFWYNMTAVTLGNIVVDH